MTFEESMNLALQAMNDLNPSGPSTLDRVAAAIRDASGNALHRRCERCHMPEMSICPRCAGELFVAAVKP